jgi:O-antigen ligase
MNHYRSDTFAGAGPLLMVVAILTCAAMAGMATALLGVTDRKALYYIGLFGLAVAGALVAITRPDPLRFSFLVLILAFPFAAFPIPPARFMLTLFDAVMVTLMIVVIGRKTFASTPTTVPLFPTASLAIASLLLVPCVVFSQFPLYSLLALLQNVAIYAFFLLALEELGRKDGLERLVLLLSIVLLIMAAGLFADHFLHLNLSLRGSNLNQSTWIGGQEIYRAGGFFQDPQRAGTFVACMITFLLVLIVRGRFRGAWLRNLVWAAVLAGLAALITTISRSAIMACVSVSALTLFLFNGWGIAAKLMIIGAALVAAMCAALVPTETWLGLLPTGVIDRFLASRVEFAYRLEIWFDTWRMFADNPYTGIGPGSFQHYLIATQPAITSYYGIGESTGVPYVPDQPESGYLKILYEGGICGALAALIVAGAALTRGLGVAVSRNADQDARSECVAALAALTVFSATFVTLFTVSDRRIAALLVFLLAVIWHRSLQLGHAAPKE